MACAKRGGGVSPAVPTRVQLPGDGSARYSQVSSIWRNLVFVPPSPSGIVVRTVSLNSTSTSRVES